MSYYNTLPTIDNGQLLLYTKSSDSCKDLVLSIFKGSPNLSFTPYDVYTILTKMGRCYPKSSVQRAITDLEYEDQLLIKTGERRKGEFHVATNCWKLCVK